jgi:hypothetical protein
MNGLKKLTAVAVLLAGGVMPAVAQRNGYNNGQNGSSNGQNGYYNGMQRGYNNRGGYNDQYDRRRYNNNNNDEYQRTHGGIGPGKGAAIGGAGGAALGALFGGGLKGAIIGGAAGAGVGAVAGKVHQDNKQNDWRDYRNDRR